MTQDSPVVVARSAGQHGETVLRRRGEVSELIVDGVFTMDTAHTATEAALARLALDRLDPDHPPSSRRDLAVLVGGLGLGVTARTLLDDPRVATVDVVELDGALVGWIAEGLVPSARGLLDDSRIRVRVADVADAVPALPDAVVDAVLLDVDNGPDFLVHQTNARVYEPAFLQAAWRVLRPGGVLAVWSADLSRTLRDALEDVLGNCEEVVLPVRRDGREFAYAVYLGRRQSRDQSRDQARDQAGNQ